MSEDKVEILRRAIDAISRRDREAWLPLFDPEAEFRADPDWPESETVRGREAVWDITVSILDAWGSPLVYMPGQHRAVGMAVTNRSFFFSAGPDRKMWTSDDLVIK